MAWLKDSWQRFARVVKENKPTRNLLTFMGFVALAALFWVVMAMNDNVQESLEIKVQVSNVPDTVTFISLPPERFHVAVRDKGTSLMRTAMFQTPVMSLNFRDFAQDGIFRVSKGDFQAALKHAFGPNAVIVSSSLDSLSLTYTSSPGRRMPVVVDYDVTAKIGMVVAGVPRCEPRAVKVYSSHGVPDTMLRVYTEPIVRRNLDDNTELTVKMKPIAGFRIIPDKVKVTIPVEPLVKKTQSVTIQKDNVPEDMELLLFPQTAKVVYYVQMSKFNDPAPRLEVRVDYNEAGAGNRLPLHLVHAPKYLYNVELEDGSVEYTIVRH